MELNVCKFTVRYCPEDSVDSIVESGIIIASNFTDACKQLEIYYGDDLIEICSLLMTDDNYNTLLTDSHLNWLGYKKEAH